MTEVVAPGRAPFAARLLAALVAFELGDDAVGELLRSAAEEYGLERVGLWAVDDGGVGGVGVAGGVGGVGGVGVVGGAGGADDDGDGGSRLLREYVRGAWPVIGPAGVPADERSPAVPTARTGVVKTEAANGIPAPAAPVDGVPTPTASIDGVPTPNASIDGVLTATTPAEATLRLDLPVRFGDRVMARLRIDAAPGSPVVGEPDLLVPLCDALGLLVGDTGPADRAATLARRFEDRRLLIETIMEQLPVGVAVTNTAGVFQLVNHRMTEIFGRGMTGLAPAGWTAGAAWMVRLDGSGVQPDEMPLMRALERGETVAPEEFLYQPPGEPQRTITVSAAPVLDAEGGLLAAVVTTSDVTESHRAAAELAAVRAGLAEQVRDLSRIQRLVDGLSHADALPDVFAELLDAVGDLLGSHVGLIMIRCPDADMVLGCGPTMGLGGVLGRAGPGEMVVAAQRGLTESQVAAIAALEQDELRTTRSAISGFDAYISGIATDPRCSPRYRAVCSLFGAVAVHSIPLRAANGRVVGTIASFFDRPYRPSQRELSMIRTCAGIGSQLIANAHAREAEHRVADELQRWMLQADLPETEGLELAARYRPATEGMLAGGDWFDVMPLAGGVMALTIGDVVGHGVPAAAEMGQLRSAVRAYALTSGADPAALLRSVNMFVEVTGVGEMTTLGYLAADPAHGTARWLSAGHSPLLAVGPDGSTGFVDTAGLTTPLGVADPEAPAAAEVAFGPGTTLVLYTDGLVERRGRDIDEGLAVLRKAVDGFEGDVDELCEHVLAECVPDGERSDDVAVLVVRNPG